MAHKILIDLEKFRSIPGKPGDIPVPEGTAGSPGSGEGLKSIRELAVFRLTCRRCSDAPCIGVCPADALDKNEEGVISRATNLCISCRSCVVICPFGTMMADFFTYHRNKETYFDLENEEELNSFIKQSPEGSVKLVDMDEDPEQQIYRLTDRILVREKKWQINNT